MAITKLQLYNIAMFALGEREIASLTEDGESRRVMDEIYVRGKGVIRFALEQGQWNHGMRAVKIDSDTSVSPDFGFTYAFAIPTDFVRLNMISSGETFSGPLTRYEFEGDYIYANVDPLYLRFVSDDSTWGADFSRWPDTFSLWVGSWMALQAAPKLMNDIDREQLKKDTKKLLVDARSKDASQEPPRFFPLSSWASSRFGRTANRERGSRGALIG